MALGPKIHAAGFRNMKRWGVLLLTRWLPIRSYWSVSSGPKRAWMEDIPVWLSRSAAVLLLHPVSRGVPRAFWISPQAFLHEPTRDTNTVGTQKFTSGSSLNGRQELMSRWRRIAEKTPATMDSICYNDPYCTLKRIIILSLPPALTCTLLFVGDKKKLV